MTKSMIRFNEKDVRKFYNFLGHEKETEMRMLDPKKKKQPIILFVHSEDEFVENCKKYNLEYNIYAGINERCGNGTEGKDVISIKRQFIDVDAPRPDTKQPATDEELKVAQQIVDKILEAFKEAKLPEPTTIFSGNGYQIAVKIPKITITDGNRKEVEDKIQLFQDRIIAKYSVDDAIDKIGDLPRIIKVTGTFNIKGDNFKERPHRLSKFITDPNKAKENSKLLDHIMSLEEEVIEVPDIEPRTEIYFDCLPKCINYLYNEYKFTKPTGWMRTVEVLVSFFRGVGLNKEKTLSMVLEWNSRQLYHENGEQNDIRDIVERIYDKGIFCANCLKIRTESSGFPYVGLKEIFKDAKLGKCCDKYINPIVYYNAKLKQKNKSFDGMAPESTDLKTFIFDKNQIIQKRVFTSHLLNDNIFAFGIMLPREEDITNKKNEVIGQVQRWRPVVITSDKRGHVVSKWMEKEYKIGYECLPSEMKLRWELKDVDDYLHKNPISIIDGKELFEEIKKQYEYYLFYREENWYAIHSLWDIGTYLHQLFSSFPLFENRGWKGTGKTQSMVVSSYISLNGTDILTNPSESTLFRETESTRPTKYIDEAEKLFKLGKFGLEPDNRVELINSSYSRNGVVPRQEKIGGSYTTKLYHVYSPTAISSINGLYGATEDRAITQIHTKSPDKDKRGEKDPEDDVNDPKWSKIRNKNYLWSLQNWKKVYDEYLNFSVETTLKKRDLQIWKPLLVIAKTIDKDLLVRVLSFAERLSKQKKMNNLGEGTIDYKLLNCLNEVIKNCDSERIYINKIREKYNDIYVNEESKDKKANVKKDVGFNQTITNRLDKIGFGDLKDKDRVGAYYELNKEIFDEIVEPITSDFSSQASHLSHIDNKDNNNVISSDNNINVMNENVTDSGLKEKSECDECDANDECDAPMSTKSKTLFQKCTKCGSTNINQYEDCLMCFDCKHKEVIK